MNCLKRAGTLLYQKENIFLKLVCASILVYLLFEEISFYVEKPTETSIVKEALFGNDIPDLVMCPEPAFDIKKLKQYGYQGFDKIIIKNRISNMISKAILNLMNFISY